MQQQTSSIKVKLNNHGRYVWEINVIYETDYESAVNEIKKIDGLLKEEFPLYTQQGAGRVANLEED